MNNWMVVTEQVNIWSEVADVLRAAIKIVPESVTQYSGRAIIAQARAEIGASVEAEIAAYSLHGSSQGRGNSWAEFIRSSMDNAACKADFRATQPERFGA